MQMFKPSEAATIICGMYFRNARRNGYLPPIITKSVNWSSDMLTELMQPQKEQKEVNDHPKPGWGLSK